MELSVRILRNSTLKNTVDGLKKIREGLLIRKKGEYGAGCGLSTENHRANPKT